MLPITTYHRYSHRHIATVTYELLCGQTNLAINDCINDLLFLCHTFFFEKKPEFQVCDCPKSMPLNVLKPSYNDSRMLGKNIMPWERKNKQKNAYEFRTLDFASASPTPSGSGSFIKNSPRIRPTLLLPHLLLQCRHLVRQW